MLIGDVILAIGLFCLAVDEIIQALWLKRLHERVTILEQRVRILEGRK